MPPEAAGERLDRFLSDVEDDFSRSQVNRAIEEGRVFVGERPATKAGAKLVAGTELRLLVPPPEPAEALPEPIPLDVRHEDADLVVVAKPAGLVVHPAQGHATGTLVNGLLHHCGDLAGIGGVLRPGIVHRLDRDTSGLLVVAKNDRAHRALADQFKDRSAYRRYLAVVHGGGRSPDAGVFATLHGRHPTDRKRFSSRVRSGKEAVTRWRVLLRGESAHLVEVKLETGRTHQIRVHFADAGQPVVGDEVYGGRRRLPPPAPQPARQALHAYALGFVHPADGRRMSFRDPPPADLRGLLDALWPSADVDEALAPLLVAVDHPWPAD